MIRLNLQREPAWLELLPGVRVLVRPITSALVMAARQVAADRVPGLTRGIPLAIAERTSAFLTALAEMAITEWQGVGDTDGNDLAVSAAGIRALLELPPVAEAFNARYFAPSLLLDAEKNVSTAAPSGTGPADTAIAATVPTPDSPAPTAAAP